MAKEGLPPSFTIDLPIDKFFLYTKLLNESIEKERIQNNNIPSNEGAGEQPKLLRPI